MEKNNGFISYGILMFLISKLYELLDTVYVVLRHRVKQISFLHAFYHSSMVLLAGSCYFISPFPATVPVLALNSFVHVVMYGYYFVTTFYKLDASTWKKIIMLMHVMQFLLALINATIGYKYHGFCIYSLVYGGSMLVLSLHSYYNAFIKKKSD